MHCPSCNANIEVSAVDVGQPDLGTGIYICFYCRFCQTLYETTLQTTDFSIREDQG